MTKTILVSGATGFIGKQLVPALRQAGWEVTALVRDTAKAAQVPELIGSRLVSGDLADIQSLQQAITGCEYVAHLAVLGHVNKEGTTEDKYQQVNAVGTSNMLEACLASGVKKIICCSTTAAIGTPDGNVIDESSPLRPITPYGRSKKAAEGVIQTYVRDRSAPVVTLVFPHVFGPGDVRDFLKIVRMIKKGIFPQIGSQPNYFPACYLSEAVSGIILALDKGQPGERYMIADDDPHDLRDIRRYVRTELGLRPDAYYPQAPKWMILLAAHTIEKTFSLMGKVPPVRPSNIKNLALSRRVDISKAKRELGFSHSTSLETAIKEMIAWYQQHRMI
ncbi:MAG: NAD-dependent epimerase/dehydratase family protein [Puniceicoccales bacterium]